MNALYREHAGADWQECEVIACHPRGYVVREVGRVLPGVRLATDMQVRCACHPRLSPAEVEIWQQQEGA